ncbi:MAG: S1/P1 nuclease [Planctomycetota bacterium]
MSYPDIYLTSSGFGSLPHSGCSAIWFEVMRRPHAPLLLLACVVAFPAWGWGSDGHLIIAEIAENRLTPAAQAGVADLIGDQSLGDISTWADQIRRQRPETRPWHYLNPPLGVDQVLLEHSPPEGSVLSCVVEQTAILRDAEATHAERSEALYWLAHMVGDIHCPMHVSKAEDRGGNDIDVIVAGTETNLHRAWDGTIWRVRGETWQETADRLESSIDEFEIDATMNPEDWATETYRYAIDYGYNVTPGTELGEDYIEQALPIIDRQFVAGGVRLAALLNEAFAETNE